MLITHQHPHNRSIVIGLLGTPNVGKSSLVNAFLGFDLTVVTDLPQTTRNQFHCTFQVDHTEVVLIDTPGVHKSQKELNLRMNHQAQEGNEDTDVTLVIFDVTRPLLEQKEYLRNHFQNSAGPLWAVFNKMDLIAEANRGSVEKFAEELKQEFPLKVQKTFCISAREGDNLHLLTGAICDAAKPAPHLYPDGDVSNKNERFFAAEYIREQAFLLLKQELPYELAVVVDEFRDPPFRKDRAQENSTMTMEEMKQEKIICYISATILVNRPSQKAIVIGTKGSMIRDIGTNARKKIEAMVGTPVHLNLHVKVSPKWYSNNMVLEELGLPRAPQSKRVWRKQ